MIVVIQTENEWCKNLKVTIWINCWQNNIITYSIFIIGAIVTDPQVTFADVVGLEQVKESLQEGIILPVKFP